jgi:predicted RNA methylase
MSSTTRQKRSASTASAQKNKKPKSRSRDLDQFYTKRSVARWAVQKLVQVLPALASDEGKRRWIEPSVGTGAFYHAVASCDALSPTTFDLIDIDDRRALIEDAPPNVRQLTLDFMSYVAPDRHCVCVGNPPFGQNASLALAFINHAAAFCDVVAFILPNSFHKLSIMNRVSTDMHLLCDESVSDNAFVHNGCVVHVPSSLFIFAHKHSAHVQPPIRGAPRALLVEGPSTSPYLTFQAGGCNADTTLMIQRVGSAAGRVTTDRAKMRGKEKSKNFYFAVLNVDDDGVRESVLRDFDMQKVKEKYWTAGMPSITKSEVVKYLTLFIESKRETK